MFKVITTEDWVQSGNRLEAIARNMHFAFSQDGTLDGIVEISKELRLEAWERVDDYWFKAYTDTWLETKAHFIANLHDGTQDFKTRPRFVIMRIIDRRIMAESLVEEFDRIYEEVGASTTPTPSAPSSNYIVAGTETLSIAEELGYTKGSVLRHLVRAGKKPGVSELEDLKTARGFLDLRIAKLEEEAEDS